jgi:hypothetical protein
VVFHSRPIGLEVYFSHKRAYWPHSVAAFFQEHENRVQQIQQFERRLDCLSNPDTFIVSLMALLGQLSISFTFQPAILALALIFLVSLAAFVINESRQKAPPPAGLSIFRYRMFVLACIV